MTTNKLFKASVLCKFVITLSLALLCHCVAFAYTPFEYNIIPQIKNNSIIDTKVTNSLKFNIYEDQGEIFYKGNLISVNDKSFNIDISKLSGKTDIVFKDSFGNESKFTFYFSNKNGKVDNYVLVDGKDLNVFVTTYKNIQIVYTDKEKSALNKLKNYINNMPVKVISNLSQIKMIPYSNTKNIAGSTKDRNIILYNFSKYNTTTQKNIIFHEITHTWANKLMEEFIIDYDYTNYNNIVRKDNNYVSKYAEEFANDSGRLSEDFADSVAFYLINQKSFKKNYPNRHEYITMLLK